MKKRPIQDRFWSKVDRSGGFNQCWPWMAQIDAWGYGRFQFANRKNRTAHRVAYELVHGAIPDGALIRHTCDHPRCVNPEHLVPGSPADNARDRDSRGRLNDRRGAANPNARLTVEQVRAIRALGPTRRRAEIAATYGVSIQLIYAILARRVWQDV